MKKKINHATKWAYRGKCRNCGHVEQWVTFDKTDKDEDYLKFQNDVLANYYPQFTAYCDGCDNRAVFDLVGLSTQKP